MYMHITHIFNLAIIAIALLQYKIFSLRPVEGTALLQEYPSVQHQLKMHNFLPLVGIAESKSIINESSPPHSGPCSSLTFVCFTVIVFSIGIMPLADVCHHDQSCYYVIFC